MAKQKKQYTVHVEWANGQAESWINIKKKPALGYYNAMVFVDEDGVEVSIPTWGNVRKFEVITQ